MSRAKTTPADAAPRPTDRPAAARQLRLPMPARILAYFLKKPSDFGQGFRPKGVGRERKLYGKKMPLDPRSALVQ